MHLPVIHLWAHRFHVIGVALHLHQVGDSTRPAEARPLALDQKKKQGHPATAKLALTHQ